MVNIITVYKLLLHGLMKLVGMTQKTIDIEPGTILNIWVPKKATEKHAVVFLHAFGFDGILTWQFQVLALAKTYAVYVPDFLFFGGSITDRSERTASFQAECMVKGLRKLGVKRCTLVGVSYGGMVGFKMAEMYPDLVESLVATCSVMFTESVSNAALERIGFDSWVDYLLPKTADALKVKLDIACYKLPTLPAFVFKHILEALFDHRKEREELVETLVISDKDFSVPRFTQKIYLLWGENDKILDMQTARNCKEQVGVNATLVSIDKAGHLPNVERPFVYNRQLRRILASLVEENGGQRS
ncbi:AB hydrolase-1 domain-containing protein [Citrus sinensis]|nr:AB hydrolase-1 domain-containing protein [Citrus sinensis]